MKEISLATWPEFVNKAEEICTARDSLKELQETYVSDLLFRGQENASWELLTTLERASKSQVSLLQYQRTLSAIRPQMETFSNRSWDLPDPPVLDLGPEDHPSLYPKNQATYGFMVHVRHHGFPSPLLDGTESPYIAAFFAFRWPSKEDRVAVFAYIEYLGEAKFGMQGAARISSKGPYVRTHERHFLQKCQYTICTEMSNEGYVFCPHGKVEPHPTLKQDMLQKLTLPAALRTEALAALDRMNINAYSLFSSEDALAETMANREYLLKK